MISLRQSSMALLLCGAFFLSLGKEVRWNGVVQLGFPLNAPSPLVIRQDGEEEISLWADYDSDPFTLPVYWDINFERWSGGKSFQAALIHHKIDLYNKPSEISGFAVTHGYNFILLNRGYELNYPSVWRWGGGVVLAHPEITIRGENYSHDGIGGSGYTIGGPAGLLSFALLGDQRSFFVGTIEVKLIGGLCWIPISGGNAFVPNLALHISVGPGFSFSLEK